MQTLYAICQWLENGSMGTTIRQSLWLFPVIETIHIFGIIFLVGSTSILDLRLMGLTFKQDTVSTLAERFLPWTWAGFVIQVVTGVLLFSSEATKMFDNRAFQVKMLLIVLAGVNAFVFHTLAYKSVGKWENDPVAPFAARFAGTFSILLWFAIVAAGRWIAYV
jgi:Na+-transporting methylmalonyl-CoA/oxaloacetate decarboxylase beta subunit